MRSVVLILFAAFAIAEPVHAQSRLDPQCPPARDSLRIGVGAGLVPALAGEVTNRDTGRPIHEALITLEPGNHRAMTDSLGAFSLAFVSAGRHRVRIRAIGFAEYSDTVSISSTVRTRLHVPLVPQYTERCPTVRRVPEP